MQERAAGQQYKVYKLQPRKHLTVMVVDRRRFRCPETSIDILADFEIVKCLVWYSFRYESMHVDLYIILWNGVHSILTDML